MLVITLDNSGTFALVREFMSKSMRVMNERGDRLLQFGGKA